MKIKKPIRWLLLPVIILLIHTAGCSTTKCKEDKNSRDSIIFKTNESIPPGTADIRGKVLSTSKTSNEITCSLKVAEVLRYGAGMRSVPPGSEIEIIIPDAVFSTAEFTEGKEIFLRISYLLPAQNENGYWNFIRINK